MVMITPMMTMIQYGSTSYENIKKLFQKNGKNFQEKINKNVGDFPLLFGRLPPPSYHHLVPAHPQQAGDSGHDVDYVDNNHQFIFHFNLVKCQMFSAFISFFQILNFEKLILREIIRHEDIKGISNSNKMMGKI